MNNLESDRLQWMHGNWLQDFLAQLGIDLTERGSLIVLGCFFIFILLVLIFVMFCFGEKNDEDFEAEKKKFMEQLAATQELHEDEKKLIFESKNFDSLVRMGLVKIIENLKESNNENENEENKEEDSKDAAAQYINKPLVDNMKSNEDEIKEEGNCPDEQTLEMKKKN